MSAVAPKVSVGIVTYNHAPFIRECLESALAQVTDFPFEIVVGEDCSTDGTRAIVEEYAARFPGRIRALLAEKNLGVFENWRRVLEACRGKYLANLDGDDRMRPGRLQKQVAHLDAHPDVAVLFTNLHVFDWPSGRSRGKLTPPGAPRIETLDDLVRHGMVYGHSSKMWRRSSQPLEWLPADAPHILDWPLTIENARHGRIAFLDELLGDYRKHAAAFTAGDLIRAQAHHEEQLRTLERARALHGVSESAVLHAQARLIYALAARHLAEGSFDRFRELIDSTRALPSVGPHHRFLLRLRAAPRFARAVTQAYLRLQSLRVLLAGS